MNEKYYIEITYNEKMVLGTFLFNSEAEAVSWWEKVSTIDCGYFYNALYDTYLQFTTT